MAHVAYTQPMRNLKLFDKNHGTKGEQNWLKLLKSCTVLGK